MANILSLALQRCDDGLPVQAVHRDHDYLWDGEVSPCLSLLHDHPEYIRNRRKDITRLALGNITNRPLPAIWESEAFSEFRARLREFHFSPCSTCVGCERFPRNFEDCIGNTFPTCGGCLWSQGFVQCA